MHRHSWLSPMNCLWLLTLVLVLGKSSTRDVRTDWTKSNCRQQHGDVQQRHRYNTRSIGTDKTGRDNSKTSTDRLRRGANDIKETQEMIGAVAMYLQHHKFFDHDWRFGKKEGMFTKSFPQPPLRTLHKYVKDNCGKGFYECLRYLHKVTTSTPMYKILHRQLQKGKKVQTALHVFMKYSNVHKEILYRPFSNHLKVFQFRTTAAYYMCWYTMVKLKPMAFFLDSCNFWNLNHDRSKNKNAFDCALYSFCPDPCCGDLLGGELPPAKCKSYQGNPCRAIHDGRCAIDMADSRSLPDLKMSKINVSCGCHEVKKGYTWSNQYAMCVELDECSSGDHTCESDQVCRNTLEGYTCTCFRGFKPDPEGACIRDPNAVLVALKDEPIEALTDQGKLFDFMGLGPYVDRVYDWLSGDAAGVRPQAWSVWLVAVLTIVMTTRWVKTSTY